MGLESTTFINGLTPSWPVSGDPKSQGDDHIRLIKSALMATFPNASKAFRLPKVYWFDGDVTLDDSYDGSTVIFDTPDADVNLMLPALDSGDDGWSCDVVKFTTSGGAILVAPPSGDIFAQVGNVATVRVEVVCSPAKMLWTGVGWLCVKSGPVVGSVTSFDGPSTPHGYRDLDGSTFDAVAYAELYLALGNSNVFFDRGGRVDVGLDLPGRLGDVMGGSLGDTGGDEGTFLSTANLPPYTPSGTINVVGTVPMSSLGSNVIGGGVQIEVPSGTTALNITTKTFTGNPQGGAGDPFSIVQPTIVSRRIIRAC